jgi:hypothetical protein
LNEEEPILENSEDD